MTRRLNECYKSPPDFCYRRINPDIPNLFFGKEPGYVYVPTILGCLLCKQEEERNKHAKDK